MFNKILSFFGQGPVWRAIKARLSGAVVTAEHTFLDGQKAIAQSAKEQEVALLKATIESTIKEILNG